MLVLLVLFLCWLAESLFFVLDIAGHPLGGIDGDGDAIIG